MNLQFGDVQETALITLAIRASETARPNARIRDEKAQEIIQALGVDVSKFDPFLSHEGVVARTILYRDQLRKLMYVSILGADLTISFRRWTTDRFSGMTWTCRIRLRFGGKCMRTGNGALCWKEMPCAETGQRLFQKAE